MTVAGVFLLTSCAFEPPYPLEKARSRPAALRFGMYITPDAEHNPIEPPERFTGYHAGLDFEVFAEELPKNVSVPVYAICDGAVLYSGFAEGYGGIVVQRCSINHEDVSVLYGHVDVQDLAREGIILHQGDRVGTLAANRSFWSGWNRKHLHLGIRKGEMVDIRGYVEHTEELENFVDPQSILPRGRSGRPVDEYRIPQPRTRKEAR